MMYICGQRFLYRWLIHWVVYRVCGQRNQGPRLIFPFYPHIQVGAVRMIAARQESVWPFIVSVARDDRRFSTGRLTPGVN